MRVLKPLILTGLFSVLLGAPAWAVDVSRDEIQQLQERVDQDAKSPEAHFDLAMGLARTVKLESGYAELKKVAELDPGFADKVIAKYSPLVEENKQNVEACFRLAFGYYFKGLNAQQAADSLAKTDPDKAKGATEEAAKSKALARQSFEAIIVNDPKYVWGYNYLGYLLFEGGEIDKGVEQWRKAISIEENAVAHFMIGQALIKQGNMKDAIPEMARAMQLRGLNP